MDKGKIRKKRRPTLPQVTANDETPIDKREIEWPENPALIADRPPENLPDAVKPNGSRLTVAAIPAASTAAPHSHTAVKSHRLDHIPSEDVRNFVTPKGAKLSTAASSTTSIVVPRSPTADESHRLTKRPPENLTDLVNYNGSRLTVEESPIISIAADRSHPAVKSYMLAKKLSEGLAGFGETHASRPLSRSASTAALRSMSGFGFFEEKPSPKAPQADRTSCIHSTTSRQRKKSALVASDLTVIFGHGFLQNMALFIAITAEFTLLCHNLLTSIATKDVDFWCKAPTKYSHMSANAWRNISTPRDANETWDPCFSYEPPISVASPNRSRIPCQAWDYDPDGGRSFIVEWNLVCERKWLVTFQKITYMGGAMAAVPIMGTLSDRVGRRPVICISVLVLLLSGIAICFTRTYESFLVMRVLVSASASTIQITSFVLLFELSLPSQQCFYCVLSLAVALAAAPAFLWTVSQLVTNWIFMQGLMMVPTSLLMCTFHVTTESPRWLVTKAKHKDVLDAIIWAARMNGTCIDTASHQWCVLSDNLRKMGLELSSHGRSSLPDIVGSPTLLRRSVIVFWCWFVIIFAYYSNRLRHVFGSFWLLLAKSSLRILSICILYLSMMKLGRRMTLYGVLLGFSFIYGLDALLMTLEIDQALLRVTISATEVFLDMAVILIFTYSLELFPTAVRSFGMCAGFFFGRIGGMVAPLFLAQTVLPPMIITGISVIAAAAVVYLPETMSSGAVDTIEDLNNPNGENTYPGHRKTFTSQNGNGEKLTLRHQLIRVLSGRSSQ